jgi:hypothetical protein
MCELFDLGQYGIDVRFSMNEEFLYSRRFDPRVDPTRPPREMAITWAQQERIALTGGPTEPLNNPFQAEQH